MKKLYIIGLAFAFTTVQALAATLCSGNSSVAAIDLTKGTRVAAATETIRYSAAWETTASGATAVVAVNGTTLKSATGTGSVAWKPTQNGTYTLTHKVMNGTTQVGSTLSAPFVVTGFPEATQTTEVPVPFAWLKAKYPELTDVASMEAKASERAANGVNTVWECYVIGLEPTAAEAKFEAAIEMVGGVPKVTWSQELGAERVYRVLGAKGLGDAAGETHRGTVWEIVTEETEGNYRFFKVVVEMP